MTLKRFKKKRSSKDSVRTQLVAVPAYKQTYGFSAFGFKGKSYAVKFLMNNMEY